MRETAEELAARYPATRVEAIVGDFTLHLMDLRLRAEMPQHVTIPGADLEFALASGEEIRVEISTKFSQAGVRAELRAVGLEISDTWTDSRGAFAVTLAQKTADASDPSSAL